MSFNISDLIELFPSFPSSLNVSLYDETSHSALVYPTVANGIIVFRLTLALFLGACIGLQREVYRQPAGIRTHALVAMASCLIMLLSAYSFGDWPSTRDPMRVAAQVVSGVGFLGAGVIIRDSAGGQVKGLTTAASIWMAAAIGLSSGANFWVAAIFATFATIVTLDIVQRLQDWFVSKHLTLILYEVSGTDVAKAMGTIQTLGVEMRNIKMTRSGKWMTFSVVCYLPKELLQEKFLRAVEIDGYSRVGFVYDRMLVLHLLKVREKVKKLKTQLKKKRRTTADEQVSGHSFAAAAAGGNKKTGLSAVAPGGAGKSGGSGEDGEEEEEEELEERVTSSQQSSYYDGDDDSHNIEEAMGVPPELW